MKALLNLLIPVFIVGSIFMGSQIMQTNYDLRYLQPQKGIATVISKEVVPAGVERRFIYVGKTAVSSPVTQQEEPTLYVELEGSEAATVVNKNQYASINIGQKISVTYYKPKYYGDPFALKVISTK